MLVGRRAQRLGEHLEAFDAQRHLAAATADGAAVDADQIAQIERCEQLEALGAEHVDARVQLDLAGAIDEIQERSLAGAAPRRDAARDAVALVGFSAVLKVLVGDQNRVDRLDVGEGVRKRAVVLRAQAFTLGAPLGDQLVQAVFA